MNRKMEQISDLNKHWMIKWSVDECSEDSDQKNSSKFPAEMIENDEELFKRRNCKEQMKWTLSACRKIRVVGREKGGN